MQKPSTIQRSNPVRDGGDEIMRADDRGFVKLVEGKSGSPSHEKARRAWRGSGSLLAVGVKCLGGEETDYDCR